MARAQVGFHENAVERIALALQQRCAPEALRVTGRFLRRGGIDINPVRVVAAPTPTAPADAAAETDKVPALQATGLPQQRVPGQ